MILFRRLVKENVTLRNVNRVINCKYTMASSEEGVSWRGAPITEIYGSQSPWGAPEFRLVVPAYNHAVLYHIPSHGQLEEDIPPKPRTGNDVWNHDFVRMPCSSQSLYPVEDANGETHLKKRWEIIEAALSKPIRNSKELADAILTYNTKFKALWKFRALHKLFEEYLEEEESQYFFDVTLPEIVKLCLALPRLVQAPIPLLTQHKNRSVSLSQQQVSSLLANAFFCTFPRRNTNKKQSEYASYPYINFNRLFNATPIDRVMEKLKCICHYFRRVCTKVPVGVVTYSRRSVPPEAFPRWAESDKLISALPLHVDSQTTIEDADGLIQVDFANKFLGGGVLNTGCVQEEIRFVICPELMLSMLFTEMLKPNEALMIIGSERYSTYTGYGGSFEWSGDFRDATPRDSSRRRRCAVLAIDALPYSNVRHEHTNELITRELNKAWVGFSFEADPQSGGARLPGVATGNWGCGAFGGTPRLKALLQAAAAAHLRRPMAYYTFGDQALRDDIVKIYNLLAAHSVSVGDLYKHIMKFTTTDVRLNKLHPYLFKVIQDKKPKSPNVITVMDTSDAAEIAEAELSGAVLKEFLNESPDLFSQGESDHSVNEFKINMDDQELMDSSDTHHETNALKGKHEEKSALNSKDAAEHTSRFFDEMQKLDEENGSLNLSTSNANTVNRRSDFKVDQSKDMTDGEERIQIELSSERKKKMGKKITDYFSKKSI